MLNRTKKAFTLLELIVVLLVLGILAAIAVPTFATVKENAAERTFQASADAIARNAAAIAASSNDGDNDVSAFDIQTSAVEAGFVYSLGSGAQPAEGLIEGPVGGYYCTSLVTGSGVTATASAASCTSGQSQT
jgi:type IV pilus assembly protein PilA